ncbi:MAG: MFS transporter [Alphaproteobacteria bacterium]|nr:MFS transporter [Alphaproteobacteria bacterium]
MLSVLSDRTYRHLFAAQVTSLAGTGLTTVALALLAYDMAGGEAGIVLGTAFAIKMVVYVILAPAIASVAHRLPRRGMLIVLDVLRAGIVLFLPFVTEVWEIYLLIALLHACSAGFTPVFQATIPDVLKDEARYTKALSLARLAYDLENLASPALAAAALVFLSYDTLFLGNAVTFLASAALVAMVRLPAVSQAMRPTGAWANLTYGARVYLMTPRLRGLFALSLAVAAAGSIVIVDTVVLARARLGGSEVDTALLLAAVGGGSMAAALVLPRVLERVSDRTVMLAGGGLLVAALAVGAMASGFLMLAVLWMVIGVGSSLVQIPAGRLLRRSAHDADRPAAFAAHFTGSHLCWLVAYPLAGWLGAQQSEPWLVFAVLAVLAGLGVGIAARVWPTGDPVVHDHEHASIDHTHPHVHDDHHQHEHDGWEGPEPHSHPHHHRPVKHRHPYVIDLHHLSWPSR